jgi:CheY-like chemotaxis protein
MISAAGTILLVDNNDDDVYIIARCLKQRGVQNPIRVMSTALEAHELLTQLDRLAHPFPRLVLLSLDLPLNGSWEFLSWMREKGLFRKTIVVTMSVQDRNGVVQRAFNLGANAFYLKTVDLLQLAETLANLEFLDNVRRGKVV